MELVGRLVLGIYGLWKWMHEIFFPRLLGLSLQWKPKLFIASCDLVPEIINFFSSTQFNCNKRAKGRNEKLLIALRTAWWAAFVVGYLLTMWYQADKSYHLKSTWVPSNVEVFAKAIWGPRLGLSNWWAYESNPIKCICPHPLPFHWREKEIECMDRVLPEFKSSIFASMQPETTVLSVHTKMRLIRYIFFHPIYFLSKFIYIYKRSFV